MTQTPTDALRLVPVSLIADTMTAMARAYERIHSLPRVSDTELAIRTGEAKERLRPYLAAPASPLPEGGGLPADVVRLVVAARMVAFDRVSPATIAELDAASEAFASRVPWDNAPDEIPAAPTGDAG